MQKFKHQVDSSQVEQFKELLQETQQTLTHFSVEVKDEVQGDFWTTFTFEVTSQEHEDFLTDLFKHLEEELS